MERILLVINPVSGSIDKSELTDLVYHKINELQWELRRFETTGSNDRKAISSEIADFNPSRILVVGGDGTINLVVNALNGREIPVAILPSGSANGLASNLKLPKSLNDQVKITLGENFRSIDQLQINGHYCLHIADMGINAELIANFEAGRLRGKIGYLLQSIPTLINTESPFHFKITIDGKVHEQSGILLAIANAKQYGTGAIINPKADINDQQFEILVFKRFDAFEIFRTIYDHADLNSENIEYFSANQALIESSDPIPFQIDGELMEPATRVEVSVSKNSLRLVVP
ncbi:MAG: diacylglycerol kinase family lipid kinase [Cyclobacteriaceae bacterium]